MRRIESMADVKRIRRRNNIILGVAMIALLVGSSLGFALMSSDGGNDNSISEMGFDFVRDRGMWKMVVGGEVFAFRYLPSEVSEVEVNIDVQLGMYSRQPLYFVNPGEGVSDILANLDRYILRYQEACLDSIVGSRLSVVGDLGNLTACDGDLPVKDCGSNLIVFEEGNESSVYGDGNCVFIVGDVIKGSDAFLYEVLGIR